MAYGTANVDVIQSSTANVPVQFNDGNGTQVGTLCRAWVNFNGVSAATIRASFNVSSVTRNGTGDYTVNFTTAMPDANYGAVTTGFSGSGLLATSGGFSYEVGSNNTTLYRTSSTFRFVTLNAGLNFSDAYSINVSVFR